MRHLLILFILFVMAQAQDPYKKIINYTLPNGMQVFLNPSSQANNIAIKVKVKVGTYSEDRTNLGASHLLEHLLFRSLKLKKNETFLQILEEKGADPNGETGLFETDYFASIEADKGLWMVDLFSKIVGDRNLTGLDVDTERKTVAVEIGKVSFIKRLTGFDWEQFFDFDFYPPTPIHESEFGLKLPPFSDDKIRLSTKRLSLTTLQQHYDNYYYPSNMILFVSGKFEPKAMQKLIQERFGSFKNREGKTLVKPTITMRDKPYYKVPKDDLQSKSIISLGVKYNELTLKENQTLIAYLEDLANRVMKELRNLEGKTYTASVFHDTYIKAGVAGITLDTTKDDFNSTYAYIVELLTKETAPGGLSQKDFQRIKDFSYKKYFEGISTDAKTLLLFAERRYNHLQDYTQPSQAYEAFMSLNYGEFVANLQRLFEADKRFTQLEMEHLFFSGDTDLFLLLSFIFSLFIIHALYTKRLPYVGILLGTLINHTLVYRFLLTVLVFVTFLGLLVLLEPIDNQLLPYFDLFNDINLGSYYLWIIFIKTPLLAWIYYYIAGIPKKMLLANDKDILLMGLRSKIIPIDTITEISIAKIDYKTIFFRRQRHYGWLWHKNKMPLRIQTRERSYVLWLYDASDVLQKIQSLKIPSKPINSKNV